MSNRSRTGNWCASPHRGDDARQLLSREGGHLTVREHEVLARRQRLVALEAADEIRLVVDLLVCRERLIFPLTVADLRRVLGAPASALLHHAVTDEIAFKEAAVGVLGGIALGIEL